MSNSKAILLSLFLICLSACSEQTIDRDQLVERDGVFYEKFSTEPFTGSVTGITSGRMSKGLFKGLVTTFDEEGRLSAEITFVNGLLDGEYSEFYPSGQLKSRGGYKDGLLDGEYSEFYPSGQLKSKSQYKDDLLEGAFELYSESGILDATFTFVAGKAEGTEYHYRENGELWFTREFRDDAIHGENREYYEGGSLKQRGMYSEGFAIGKWEFLDEEGEQSGLERALTNVVANRLEDGEVAKFHENGFVESAGLKKNGLKDGPWNFYDEEGELLRTVEYEDGKVIASSE